MSEFKFNDAEIKEALARIGSTRDGGALRQLLADTLLSVASANADTCALQVEAGRRNFAHTLLKVINAGSVANVSGAESIRRSEPVAGSARRRGSERRVPASSE